MNTDRTKIVFEKLIENMAEGVWVGDDDERTVYANPRFLEMVGYSLEEIIGWESYEFRDRESTFTVKHENTHKRTKGESSSYEGKLVHKDGSRMPVLVNGTALPDGGTVGIHTDLTQLKKREESNAVYKKLIEHMDEAVCFSDKNEKTVYANPKFLDLLGYSLEEIIGKKSYMFWDEESAKTVEHENTHKRKKGKSSSYQGNLVTKGGGKIPVLAHGTLMPDGGTIGILTDISVLKEKEENERVLLSAVKYSTDSIIMFDVEGQIQSWNKGAKIMFGYRSEDIIGRDIIALFQKKDIKMLLKESEVIYKYELQCRHENGTDLTVSATVTPIFDKEKKNYSSFLLICRDITNQRKVEEEIELKYDKIREVYQKIGTLKRQNDYIFELLGIFEQYFHDLKSIGDFVVTSIIMLTQIDACVLRLYNKKKDNLEMISNFGLSGNWEGKRSIPYKKSLLKKAIQSKKSLKILDISQEPYYYSPGLARKSNVSSMLLIPLKYKGEVLGSLSLYTSPDKKLEIFENEFIEKYTKVIELVIAGAR